MGECGLSAWQRASITLAGKRTLLTTDGRQAFAAKLVECDKWPRVLNLAVETVSHLMNEKHVEVQQWDGWLDKPFQHSLRFCCFFHGFLNDSTICGRGYMALWLVS